MKELIKREFGEKSMENKTVLNYSKIKFWK